MSEWVLSLCDESGIMVQPWAEAGYRCICVDLATIGTRQEGLVTFVGADVRGYLPPLRPYIAAFAFPPCTHTAVSGAKHFKRKGLKALIEALEVVEACRRILEWTETAWMLENPVSTISTYWRLPDYTFNPSDYAGYSGGENDTYPKRTCVWAGGGFVMPHSKPLPQTDTRIHSMGPGPERSRLRSKTPPGFSRAVFEANANRMRQLALAAD